jgi:adenosylmethionine-8-amino-7-oxononanoate aminotransferase
VDRATKKPFPAERRVGAAVCRLLREQGILVRPLGDVLVVMPPLAIDEPFLDRLGDTLYNCLRAFDNEV